MSSQRQLALRVEQLDITDTEHQFDIRTGLNHLAAQCLGDELMPAAVDDELGLGAHRLEADRQQAVAGAALDDIVGGVLRRQRLAKQLEQQRQRMPVQRAELRQSHLAAARQPRAGGLDQQGLLAQLLGEQRAFLVAPANSAAAWPDASPSSRTSPVLRKCGMSTLRAAASAAASAASCSRVRRVK